MSEPTKSEGKLYGIFGALSCAALILALVLRVIIPVFSAMMDGVQSPLTVLIYWQGYSIARYGIMIQAN